MEHYDYCKKADMAGTFYEYGFLGADEISNPGKFWLLKLVWKLLKHMSKLILLQILFWLNESNSNQFLIILFANIRKIFELKLDQDI